MSTYQFSHIDEGTYTVSRPVTSTNRVVAYDHYDNDDQDRIVAIHDFGTNHIEFDMWGDGRRNAITLDRHVARRYAEALLRMCDDADYRSES